jgi:hypothetical protein
MRVSCSHPTSVAFKEKKPVKQKYITRQKQKQNKKKKT